MDIAKILSRKFIGEEWSLTDSDYSGLVWLSDSKKPTLKQLEKLWSLVEYEEQYEEVQRQRLQAYQQTADPIFFKYQAGLATKEEWLNERSNVDKLFPYPEPII